MRSDDTRNNPFLIINAQDLGPLATWIHDNDVPEDRQGEDMQWKADFRRAMDEL